MGARGNIGVVQSDGETTIYLYTHWRGYAVADVVADVLARGERLDDRSYLTRILFDALTDGDRGTTGFGISTGVEDNEYPIPVVNTSNGGTVAYDGRTFSFRRYIEHVKGRAR